MDPKTVLNVLKQASPFDLFLLSFLLLPFVFSAWVDVAKNLDLPAPMTWLVLGAVLLLYIVGVVLTLVGSSRTRNREIARDQIIQYLTAKGFEMMSFERVRSNINKAYSDEFLQDLTVQFPNDLRRARLKGSKPGLARIVETAAEDAA